VKKVLFAVVLVLASVGGTVLWMKSHASAGAGGEEGGGGEGAGITVKHDDRGNVVLTISDETAANMGLKLASPAATQLAPEIRGFGRVQDAAALAGFVTDLAVAQATCAASSNEFARLQGLAPQGNTSARALQAAEAAATHDQLAVQAAKDKLVTGWCPALADQPDLPGLVHALTTLDAAIVRVNLPAGEQPQGTPLGARIVTFFGGEAQAQFLGQASAVDPQTQRRGLIFLVRPNPARLPSGEAVTCFVQLPGESAAGVTVPRDAVVRTEGAGWVYLMGTNKEVFTRTEIPLTRATEDGWFITNGLTAQDHIVVSGAQTLLSEEQKGLLQSD
jgi:hypothetical protein